MSHRGPDLSSALTMLALQRAITAGTPPSESTVALYRTAQSGLAALPATLSRVTQRPTEEELHFLRNTSVAAIRASTVKEDSFASFIKQVLISFTTSIATEIISSGFELDGIGIERADEEIEAKASKTAGARKLASESYAYFEADAESSTLSGAGDAKSTRSSTTDKKILTEFGKSEAQRHALGTMKDYTKGAVMAHGKATKVATVKELSRDVKRGATLSAKELKALRRDLNAEHLKHSAHLAERAASWIDRGSYAIQFLSNPTNEGAIEVASTMLRDKMLTTLGTGLVKVGAIKLGQFIAGPFGSFLDIMPYFVNDLCTGEDEIIAARKACMQIEKKLDHSLHQLNESIPELGR